MSTRILVLGAGFGGLELCSTLSEAIGGDIELTLIDKNDSFVFGFSKLDVLFGRARFDEVGTPYRTIMNPAIRFRRENVVSIDPASRRVVTDKETYESDILVVALGADYDLDATPGISEGPNEFYSIKGVEHLRKSIPAFTKGHAVVGVVSAPFKCPPAPSEAALLLHDDLTARGVRDACDITLVMPFPVPIPPSPDTSRALLAAFSQRDIRFVPWRRIASLDSARRVAVLDDGSELPCDLFLGIPKHKVPEVLNTSGMTEEGWVHVDPTNLRTKFPGVYAVGDVTDIDTPMAGVFAEGAARVAAASIIADLKGGDAPPPYNGAGSCYIEFGAGLVGRVDVNFPSGSTPTGSFTEPSVLLASEKAKFGSSRRLRWFGGGPGLPPKADA